MILHILVDSYPLGLLATPARSTAGVPINNWITACLAAGHEIYIPEVIDYELRRELLRAQKRTASMNGIIYEAPSTFCPSTPPRYFWPLIHEPYRAEAGFRPAIPKNWT